MELLNDLLPSFSWSLVGFTIGWLVGREMLFISQIREAVVPEEEIERTEQRLPAPNRNRLLGIVVIILALFTVTQGSYYAYETNKKSECQAQYNADFARVIGLRAKWSDEDKKAETKLWRDFLAAKPGQSRKILQTYLDATERTDKLRAENPLPKLEDRNC
jgi:hypothetical protein